MPSSIVRALSPNSAKWVGSRVVFAALVASMEVFADWEVDEEVLFLLAEVLFEDEPEVRRVWEASGRITEGWACWLLPWAWD